MSDLPPGERDLACAELWERSLIRSRRRREAAAARRPGVERGAAALMTATLVAPGVAAADAAPAASVSQAGAGQGDAVAASISQAGTGYLRLRSRGDAVAAAQRALGIPADGIFGPQTRWAVLAFQRAHGLEVDGIVGPATSAALGLGAPARRPAPPAATTLAVQRALGIGRDGVYGPITRAAVRSFQAAHALTVDGIVGPQTLAALGIAGAAPPSSGAAPPSPASGAGAVAAARSKLGAPFAPAGTGPSGFDCSGLTQWAMAQAGISIPRTSFAQYGVGTPVSRPGIQAGDLVFFNADGPGASHVGIATGPTTAISATTHGVMEHSIGTGYWGAHYVGARRVG